MSKESEAIRQLDREILKLKAELPREYVTKEDFIVTGKQIGRAHV